VPLRIVVTGGSGLVPGLKEAVRVSVTEALHVRHFDRQTCDAVQTVNRYEPRFTFETEAEVARRAVCFGAADPDKPGFRYMEKMDAPTPAMRLAGARWV
jgi:hypothetical protein